jgi:NAD(P)-dependent dehydrogenase (short-subunit alcohol dehydrogenase family)
MISSGIQLTLDPRQWQKHLFGLPRRRWAYLKDKSFWITGAGTGYGRCIAIALAAAGAKVFLTGRRKQKLDETIQEIEKLRIPSQLCYPVPADITDCRQIKKACDTVISSCDELHGLVNNAALPARGDVHRPLLDGSIEDWERIITTNVTAPWFLTRTILPHMLKGGALRVLFISSEAGWAFTAGFGPYNVSKAALNNLGASMAAECAIAYPEADLQINVLVPGEARTEMNQGAANSPYILVGMALALLSHPKGGPNGRFFYWDGRHRSFCYASPYEKPIL